MPEVEQSLLYIMMQYTPVEIRSKHTNAGHQTAALYTKKSKKIRHELIML